MKTWFNILMFSSFASTGVLAQDLPQTSPIENILNEDAIRTLRDPFLEPSDLHGKKEAPKSDLELYALKDIVLNGVITGKGQAKAMVTLPDGKSKFIVVGTRIGKREGQVVVIAGEKIKVVEYDYDLSGKRIPKMYQLSVSGEMQLLTNKEK